MTYPLGSLSGAASQAAPAATSTRPAGSRASPSVGAAPSAFAPFARLARAVRPSPQLEPVWRAQFKVVIGGLLLLLWLLAMVTHDAADAAFSTTGATGAAHNLVGHVGAWASDLSYVLLGYSVWWCLAFSVRGWLSALARLLRADHGDAEPEAAQSSPVAPPSWLLWIGMALVLVASTALEWTRLYRFEPRWPAHGPAACWAPWWGRSACVRSGSPVAACGGSSG